jgi:hypothetical protein
LPLEYSSDEDLVYIPEEDKNIDEDIFQLRVDENAKLLQSPDNILSDEERVKLFVA